MRVLVTGGCGFVGRHAAVALAAAGHEVVRGDLCEGADILLDVCDRGSLVGALRGVGADAVLHLGGLAFVPMAWCDPGRAFGVNTVGTMNVLEAVREVGGGVRVLVVTSAEVYGSGCGGGLVGEEAPLCPDNLYGVTKAAADAGARLYAAHFGLDVMTARPSNHIGPGQHANFVTSAFARQLKAIAGGGGGRMRVGNLDQVRDFTDVRDVVRAYVCLLERGVGGGAYNIASGRRVKIREVLEMLMEIAGVRPEVEVDPGLFRPTDRHVGLDVGRIRRETGWVAEIPLEASLRAVYAEAGCGGEGVEG